MIHKSLTAVTFLIWMAAWTGCVDLGDTSAISNGANQVEYNGQFFTVSKAYSDYDEFKEDPGNFSDQELGRIVAAVRAVEFVPSATDRESVMEQMFDMQFPGFGCGSIGVPKEYVDDVAAFTVEIPRTNKNRVLGYVRIGGRFRLVADFESSEEPMIFYAGINDDKLEFYSMDKQLLHSEPIQK